MPARKPDRRRNNRTIRKEQRASLRDMRRAGIERVRILDCQDQRVCSECHVLDGTVIQLETAMRDMPLPNRCSGDYCRCVYLAVF